MYTSNNQVIFEEIYDENIQPTEEEIIEYANFLGIDTNDEPELMWIARQGVMAPLPRGWKPVQDPQGELYYFNFETGESIWDHPCDQDYKKQVIDERKILLEKGKDAYNAGLTESRQPSPVKGRRSPALGTLKNSTPLLNNISTMKSTSTISEIINGKQNTLKNSMRNMRSDFGLFDSKEMGVVEFEEEQESKAARGVESEDEESEPSWQKKSGSEDSSDSFRKPVDFGIDKDISTKLDKLNLMLMVGKEKEQPSVGNRASVESAVDVKKSLGESMTVTRQSLDSGKSEPEYQRDLNLFALSLEREFDQKRLELLEGKDERVRKVKVEIEEELIRMSEAEKKRIIREQDEKLKELRERMQADLHKEKEMLRKRQEEVLSNIQHEFEAEKQLKKEKCSMQISKFISSGQNLEELDENEEKRELEIYFEHIEKKYSDKLIERKKELEKRYAKKTLEVEAELERLYEEQAEKKESELKALKEKNFHIESYDKKMEEILKEKIDSFKAKEKETIDSIKQDYEMNVKTFRDKYKDLEKKEFEFLEGEFNRRKVEMDAEHKKSLAALEKKMKSKGSRLDGEEVELKKRADLVEERRRAIKDDWEKLNEEEKKLDEKKTQLYEQFKAVGKKTDEQENYGYELERLRLENTSLETKVENLQRLLDKLYESKDNRTTNFSDKNHINQENNTQVDISITANNDLDTQITKPTSDLEANEDDDEIRALIRQAKHKLKMRYLSGEVSTENDEDEVDSSASGWSENHSQESLESNLLCDFEELSTVISEKRSHERRIRSSENLLRLDGRGIVAANLKKERDISALSEELLDKFRENLEKRKMAYEAAKGDVKLLCSDGREAEERKLNLEKEGLVIEEMVLGLKAAKRLIKQKKNQLGLIELNVMNKSGSVDDFRELSGVISEVSVADLSNDRNLNELLVKVKGLAEDNHRFGKRLGPIFKVMPRVSSKLRATLRSLARLSGQEEILESNKSGGGNKSLLDEKWNIFLNSVGQESKSQAKFANTNRPYEIISPLRSTSSRFKSTAAWENTFAYHKLAFDSGTELLQEKWHQYIGDTNLIVDKPSFEFSKKLQKSSTGHFKNSSSLPLGTQQRLNQHREWLKKFKANSDFQNSSIFF